MPQELYLVQPLGTQNAIEGCGYSQGDVRLGNDVSFPLGQATFAGKNKENYRSKMAGVKSVSAQFEGSTCFRFLAPIISQKLELLYIGLGFHFHLDVNVPRL